MKQGLILLFICSIFFMDMDRIFAENNPQVIPDEAIRLRILAHSDQEHEQQVKLLVRDAVARYIHQKVETIDQIEEARQIIAESMPEIRLLIAETLYKAGSRHSFTATYQSDVSFPEKQYGNYVYPEGLYEAVLITIGDGIGANWWCVLFPPLCFLDFVHEPEQVDPHQEIVIENKKEEKREIKFFFLEWLGLS